MQWLTLQPNPPSTPPPLPTTGWMASVYFQHSEFHSNSFPALETSTPPMICHFHAGLAHLLPRRVWESRLSSAAAAVRKAHYAICFWITLFAGICQAFVFCQTKTIIYLPSLSVNSAAIKDGSLLCCDIKSWWVSTHKASSGRGCRKGETILLQPPYTTISSPLFSPYELVPTSTQLL